MDKKARRRIIIRAGITFYITVGSGITLIIYSKNQEFLSQLRADPLYYAGLALGVLGAVYFFLALLQTMLSREDRFVDVDEKSRDRYAESVLESLRNEIEELKSSKGTLDYEQLEAILKSAQSSFAEDDALALKDYRSYFSNIRRVLEQKAANSDEKASKLLDKGTTYTWFGIVFFLTSIVVWQIVTAIYGVKEQHIYGILSCSLLFIFIEFLSAWFLKQYRHFVDTSTYLIKVKAVFDRYILAYLAMTEFAASSANKERAADNMYHLLRDNIRWPEMPGKGNKEIGFARDAIESITELAKAISTKEKPNKKKPRPNR